MSLQLANVPEFRKCRPAPGTAWYTRGLGRCPAGWHTHRVDIALFHRGPIARVTEQQMRRRIYLERRGYTAWEGRYLIGEFEHVERPERCMRPWRPAIPWLMDLTPGFEITAVVWCAPGEKKEIDMRWDWFLPWPHASWPWLEFVVAGGWVFQSKEEELQ
jgi:hypothetical protein